MSGVQKGLGAQQFSGFHRSESESFTILYVIMNCFKNCNVSVISQQVVTV